MTKVQVVAIEFIILFVPSLVPNDVAVTQCIQGRAAFRRFAGKDNDCEGSRAEDGDHLEVRYQL